MTLDRSTAPAPAEIRPFRFPAVDRRALPNGVTLLTAPSGDLPIVTIRAVIEAGAAAEQRGEEGLAWLTANALEGGTTGAPAGAAGGAATGAAGAATSTGSSGDELAWRAERLGAQLETWITWDGLFVSLTTPAHRLSEAMDLLAEVVRAPAFPAREVERLRDEQGAEILRRSTEPRVLADDSAARYIFAPSASYGRPLIGERERVSRFTASEVRSFHERQFTPGNTALVIVGAVSAADAEREAQRAFGDWSGESAPAPAASSDARADTTTIYIVDRPSAVQSEIRIGHVGVQRDHPDHAAILVMNALLGGAFTSRLNLCLRERHGFTYGVRSGYAFRRQAGPFVIQTAVASDVTSRAVSETLRELRELQQNGVTHDEVRNARDFLAGTLPLEMQTTEQLAARVADLHVHQLPVDYFESHRTRLSAVTREDVERVAREHIHLDRLAIVVIGNRAAIEADLAALGVGNIMRESGPSMESASA